MTKFKRTALALAGLMTAVAAATPALADPSFLGETFSCESASSDLGRILEDNQPPSSIGVVEQMEHLMWMLESAINVLDSSCSYEPGYASTRASFQNSLDSARRTCSQVSSTGSCYAHRYQ